jgi:tetratricopeptide (TPR) repeat protein
MRLSLEWLGPPTVWVGDRIVPLGVKAVSLLALLSVEGRMRRRDLGRWLWGGANDPLNSVSSARVGLGRAIGADFVTGDSEHLWLEGDWRCDVAAFRAAWTSQDVAVGHTAWSSWRGVFLEGLRLGDWARGLGEEFENWLYTQREKLEVDRADLASKLARELLERDETARAVTFLEVTQAQGSEPREDAARLLILAHGTLGNGDAATQVYARLERCLHSELGVAPTPQTRAALEVARSGAAESRAALRAESSPAVASPPPLETDAPFVGRQAELDALLEVFARRGDDGAQVVLITGEPGAGKTRLLSESVARIVAARPEARIARVSFNLSNLPFAGGIALTKSLVKLCAARLEQLQPVWRELLLRLAPHVDADERRHVIVLDDLQWADGATMDLLSHLLETPNLIVAATLRDTEPPRASLEVFEAWIVREGRGLRLSLAGLSHDELATLAGRLGRGDVDAGQLHRSSGGNPFYALELLRARDANSRAHDIVRLRLQGLSRIERQVLEALAVLGDHAAQTELRGVAGRSLEEITDALESLSRAALLHFEPDHLRFAHDLTREVIERDLSPVRAALLHLRAARAASPSAGSAAHYWAGRDAWESGDAARAVTALLEAGRMYARHTDLQGALVWFERALAIAPDLNSQIRTWIESARQHERFGQHAQALEALDNAEALLTVEFDAVLASDASITRAHLLALKLGQPDAAEPLVQRALNWLAAGSEAAQTQTLLALRADGLSVAGTIARLRGDAVTATTYFRQALTLRRALRDPWHVSAALNNLSTALIQRRDSSAERTLREAIELSESSGDAVGLARALNNLGVYHNEIAARHEEARIVYERVLELQRGIGDAWGIASATLNLGVTAFFQGRFEQARVWYRQTLDWSGAHDLNERRLEALYNLAEVNLKLGDLEAALGFLNDLRLEPRMRDDAGVRELRQALEVAVRGGER